jgi:aldehyde:ferredoxin oxidoreductase
MPKGWTGKRLRIDLTLRKAWCEDIPEGDLRQYLGGRGLHASFFQKHFPTPASSAENPIAFAAGPLTGTLAPCSGWTSIAAFSPFSDPPRYAFTRMPGHFSVPLKGAGFDQCVLQGKSDRPLYLWIDNGKVKFEDAGHLWGKGTTETTVAIQEEKEDRNIEVLCIGPAGERRLPFANVIHRLSWTGDRLGLGYLFGVKNLKAVAIRGKKPVVLHDPARFLDLCLTLKDRIQNDRKLDALKEKGTVFLLGRDRKMGTEDGNGSPSPHAEQRWTASLSAYLAGQESCFSCPVHCGRNIQREENYTGGIHLEKAWHLGPRIGVFNGDWTLKLHHFCQVQGLDPFLTGSLLARILHGVENGSPSNEDLGQTDRIWEQGERAFLILSRFIPNGKDGFQFKPSPCSENEDLDVLADVMPFCKIVVNRLNRVTLSNMIGLIDAAAGEAFSIENLRDAVQNIRRTESLLRNEEFSSVDQSSFPRADEGQMNETLRMEEHSNESTVHRTIS